MRVCTSSSTILNINILREAVCHPSCVTTSSLINNEASVTTPIEPKLPPPHGFLTNAKS